MSTTILPAQDCFVSYKEKQNRHAGRFCENSRSFQSRYFRKGGTSVGRDRKQNTKHYLINTTNSPLNGTRSNKHNQTVTGSCAIWKPGKTPNCISEKEFRKKYQPSKNKLSSPPIGNLKKDPKVRAASEITSSGGEDLPFLMDDLLITSTESLGPDPSALPKEPSGVLQNGLKSELRKDNALSSGKINVSSSMPCFEEEWAGPAYSISPPPSSLPFPKFYLQQQMGCVKGELSEDSRLLSINTSVSENEAKISADNRSNCNKNLNPSGASVVRSLDSSHSAVDALATRDLRRFLGLD
eukprot:TRINITY_DN686_c0_g1_i2.p1 TRINITY_DN686_c0_g1~~TRINITY_DN686_c0_g1_i2.p1  ORF type:complete len:297 (-),score=35.99 TRINITY_DN686_c0_g1_i2:340-1230(-)